MRILSVVGRSYYGQPNSIESMFLWFTEPLRQMGHEVEHFDHIDRTTEIGPDACGEAFVKQVRSGGYDAIIYQTAGRDHMNRSAISDAKRYAPIIAWNSDDDWQWESYSQHICPLFTYAVTTYPHVWESARKTHSNLLLSQWGCLETTPSNVAKDLDFTFVGQVYRTRVAELRYLRRKAKLKIFGLGSLRVSIPPLNNWRIRSAATRLMPSLNRALAFDEVMSVWNRSKVSYTPLGSSKDGKQLQVKARVFEMGMSRTLMLASRSDALDPYYEEGREYIAFDNLKDCAEKARFYLLNETGRRRIIEAYTKRTLGEHLWHHRFTKLFRDVGLSAVRRQSA